MIKEFENVRYQLILIFLILGCKVYGQTPEKMSYQAVIRDSGNDLVINSTIGMKISILRESVSGTPVYVETHNLTTTTTGLVSLEIGTGSVVSGDISSIDWGADVYYLKTETDPSGGTTYTITGISQLVSVPYALHSKSAETVNNLENGKIFLGNASGQAIPSTISGDATLASDGTLTVGSNTIGSEEVTDNSLTADDLGTGSVAGDEISDGTIGNNDLDKLNIPLSGFDDPVTDIAMGNNKIINLADPVSNQDAATKAYVDLLESKLFELEDQLYSSGAISVKDAEGNVYKNVKIGDQVWMAENLKTTTYNDGINITLVSGTGTPSTPAYFWYDDNQSNGDIYGALYNWYAVETGKLCPTGWHVPTKVDWTTLQNYLINNGFNYDGTTSGNKIAKSLASTSGWNSTSVEGSVGNTDYPTFRNKTGFSALPGGFRDTDGTFYNILRYTFWWSSTLESNPWYRSLLDDHVDFGGFWVDKEIGYSVRCIKGEADGTIPPGTYEIGDPAFGGIVAYILQNGDPGYDPNAQHGIIVTTYDVSTAAYWGCQGTDISGADGSAIGTGKSNTEDIIAGCTTAGIAAKLCYDLELNGFDDWYLPSIDELNQIYLNKATIDATAVAIGGTSFVGVYYWSSTEVSSDNARRIRFDAGFWAQQDKDVIAYRVRAVRSF